VSEWLSSFCANGKVPYVPHMIHLPVLARDVPRDLRAELGISREATVFATYGGATSFDIKFVREEVIPAVLAARDDLYFIFMNIEKFMNHPRVIFLPGSSRGEDKVKFINTSDAMLHARESGESFGLACGEFSISNKPIFTYGNCRDKCHLEILGDKAF